MFLRLLGKPLIGRVLWNMQPTDAETLRKRVFGTLMAHPERVAPAALEVGRVNASFASSKRCVRTMLGNVCDWNGWRPELAMREAMTSLPTPTLFAWGDKDSFAPASSGQELAARMPNARVEVIKDTGHLPQCDSPDALAKLIAAFGLAVVLCIFSIGCVGDNATTIDAGSPDASIRQDASTDAASVNCVYGTGEFGNCKFGP
jgi:pimeloyl-ACP methyl ester carboxylesterase